MGVGLRTRSLTGQTIMSNTVVILGSSGQIKSGANSPPRGGGGTLLWRGFLAEPPEEPRAFSRGHAHPPCTQAPRPRGRTGLQPGGSMGGMAAWSLGEMENGSDWRNPRHPIPRTLETPRSRLAVLKNAPSDRPEDRPTRYRVPFCQFTAHPSTRIQEDLKITPPLDVIKTCFLAFNQFHPAGFAPGASQLPWNVNERGPIEAFHTPTNRRG